MPENISLQKFYIYEIGKKYGKKKREIISGLQAEKKPLKSVEAENWIEAKFKLGYKLTMLQSDSLLR